MRSKNWNPTISGIKIRYSQESLFGDHTANKEPKWPYLEIAPLHSTQACQLHDKPQAGSAVCFKNIFHCYYGRDISSSVAELCV